MKMHNLTALVQSAILISPATFSLAGVWYLGPTPLQQCTVFSVGNNQALCGCDLGCVPFQKESPHPQSQTLTLGRGGQDCLTKLIMSKCFKKGKNYVCSSVTIIME